MDLSTSRIFVNLPVKDLQRSVAFFTELGFSFNPQFTDENATCMVVNDSIYVMLLVEDYFRSFTKKELPDASTPGVIIALSLDNREKVDQMVAKALEIGAGHYSDVTDHGFMYTWGFHDLDGHVWELFYMDPAAVQQDQA